MSSHEDIHFIINPDEGVASFRFKGQDFPVKLEKEEVAYLQKIFLEDKDRLLMQIVQKLNQVSFVLGRDFSGINIKSLVDEIFSRTNSESD
jgi:hypothetical protein